MRVVSELCRHRSGQVPASLSRVAPFPYHYHIPASLSRVASFPYIPLPYIPAGFCHLVWFRFRCHAPASVCRVVWFPHHLTYSRESFSSSCGFLTYIPFPYSRESFSRRVVSSPSGCVAFFFFEAVGKCGALEPASFRARGLLRKRSLR